MEGVEAAKGEFCLFAGVGVDSCRVCAAGLVAGVRGMPPGRGCAAVLVTGNSDGWG
jgi:hypothetical protein